MITPPPYIDAYEKRAYGLFLHYGLYSLLGEGEWVSHHHKLNRADYNKLTARFTAEAFNPREMAAWAKSCGLRYLCLTTRHHDGFSLYDTRGLNTFDAPHSAANRDLVNEFVEACRSQDLGVFFYHTTLDWNEPSFDQDWKSYLAYLRDSVEILCTQYGKIDGLWFDGNWARRDRDWEEDKLYQMIRSHQQDCIIINNSSLSALGAKGHPELDVLTFEQGRPTARTHREGEKYLAAEMCETINGHWGTARHDFSHKSPAELISTFASCRRYRANFLLNIGPLGSGAIPAYEKATLDLVGEWIQLIGPVLYEGLPTTLTTRGEDFVLSHGGEWFYFCHHLPIQDNMHLAHGKPRGDGWQTISGKELPPIERIEWVDCGENLAFTQDHDQGVLAFAATPNKYGHQNIVRVARLVPR